ncbi:MAG: hypothetical protein ACYTGN_15710 [Planctomycetota bacterium]|jgi:hypothetical protein
MRDRRDYLIAAMAAALLFSIGVLAGGGQLLPSADAQGGGAPTDNAPGANSGGDNGTLAPDQPIGAPPNAASTNPGGGGQLGPGTNIRPGFSGRGTAPTASDSDSNNRFVAVTTPVGSGESVLFLIDSKSEQVAVYRFVRRKGLEFLAARKIDYDLRVKGYGDVSDFSRDDMKRFYEKSMARAVAKAAKGK